MPASRRPGSGESAQPVALWRERTFRSLWAGQTASLFGDQVTGLALPWLILLQTHSPLIAGLVASARYLPLVTLGLVAGLVGDHLDLRGRVNAAGTVYAATLRGVAAIGGGALAASGSPLPAFLLLAGVCACAALVATRARV